MRIPSFEFDICKVGSMVFLMKDDKLVNVWHRDAVMEFKSFDDVFPKPELKALSPAEKKVCRLLIKGLSVNKVAEKLGKGSTTVFKQEQAVRRRFNCEGVKDLRKFLKKNKYLLK